jgi:hypothetical protein
VNSKKTQCDKIKTMQHIKEEFNRYRNLGGKSNWNSGNEKLNTLNRKLR